MCKQIIINKLLFVFFIFLAYFVYEVRHDYHVSLDSRGGNNNEEWHRDDMWFHIMIALSVVFAIGIQYGALIGTSRALFFDTRFSKKWHGDIFYVGENEPDWKKKYIKLYRLVSLILYIINVYLIFKL